MKRGLGDAWLMPQNKKGGGARVGGGKVGGKSGGKGGGGKGGGIPWDHGVPQTMHAFKALVPDEVAAALLGNGGSMKDAIQRDTGSKLVFSNRGDYFPGSKFRVLGIYADDDTSILGAFDQIMQRIIHLGDEERKNPPPLGPELLGKEPGEYIFRFCVTRRMCTQIIGTGGTNISKIRAESGAKVFIENETQGGHRLGRVIGLPEHILQALAQVNEMVQQECQEPIFVAFAGVVNFGDKSEYLLDELFADPSEPKGKGKDVGGKAGKMPARGSAPALVGMPVPGKGGKGKGKAKVSGGMPPASKGSGRGGGEGDMTLEGSLERLAQDIGAFPEGTTEIPYSMECDMPSLMVSELAASDLFAQIQDTEGVAVTVLEVQPPKAEGEEETQRLGIVGGLPNIYTAHAVLIKRSAEIQAEWEEVQRAEEEAKAEPAEDPEALKAKIMELQAMLKRAEGQ